MKNNKIPKIIFWHKLSDKDKIKLLNRPYTIQSQNKRAVIIQKILKKIKLNGDNALKSLTLDFDNIKIDNLRINNDIISQAKTKISEKFKQAIKVAKHNIKNFHITQKIPKINVITSPGIICQQITRPLNSVGFYIPGKSAPLISTVLMLSIPATIAGCKRIIMCSPPPIANEILYTASLCNIKEIYQVGGGQAIAAMGFGTESINKVDKIFGPGNPWVTEAKRQICQEINGPDIDMLAGPTELLIIADNKANPKFIAADLLSQAEHGYDSQVILLTTSKKQAEFVKKEINKQLSILPKINIIKKSLNNSLIIITSNLTECIKISNKYGPEHLIIQTKYPQSIMKLITNAGSIFLGDWAPESVGDFASGTNHVLPTYGKTLTNSGISVLDFQKRISVQQLSTEGLLNIAPIIETLAEAEGLIAHKNAVTTRTNVLKGFNNEH